MDLTFLWVIFGNYNKLVAHFSTVTYLLYERMSIHWDNVCEKFVYKVFQDNTEEDVNDIYKISHIHLFIYLTVLEYLLCAKPSSR